MLPYKLLLKAYNIYIYLYLSKKNIKRFLKQ